MWKTGLFKVFIQVRCTKYLKFGFLLDGEWGLCKYPMQRKQMQYLVFYTWTRYLYFILCVILSIKVPSSGLTESLTEISAPEQAYVLARITIAISFVCKWFQSAALSLTIWALWKGAHLLSLDMEQGFFFFLKPFITYDFFFPCMKSNKPKSTQPKSVISP